MLTFGSTILLSIVIIAIVTVKYKEWRSYAIGAVVGQLLGAALLSVTVVLVSPYFLTYFTAPLAATITLPLFVWTFATEVPFVLLWTANYKSSDRAFPSLRRKELSERK